MQGTGSNVDFLQGGGATGALMRAHDWSSSPLDPPETWPQSLRAVVALLLNSKFPMFVAWGEDLGFLYNDPYAEILGAKHPKALGNRFHDIWSEIWPDIWPLIQAALAGQATYRADLPLIMNRKGFDEKTWFTFSYSPVRDESGRVAGMFCACNETTDKIFAQRRVQAEFDRLRDLFQQAPSFVAVLTGPDHRFEFVNESYQRLIGKRDVIGMAIRDALPELAGQDFFEHLDRVYRSGEPYIGRAEKVVLRRAPDAPAEEFLVDFIYKPMKRSDGAVSGIFVEGYDVTEHIRAEAALRESEARLRDSEQRYRTLFDSIDEGFCVIEFVDKDGRLDDFRYIEANPALEPQSGITGVLGRTAREVLAGDAQEWIDIFANVQRSGEPIRFERRLAANDRLLELFAFRVEPESRRQIGVIFQDITARRGIEAALRDSEARFRNLADAMPQLVWTASPDGRVDYYNARRAHYGGIEQEADLHWSWAPLVHPEDRAATRQTWARSSATGEPYSCEHRLALADGTWAWHVSRAECVRDESGAIAKWYGTAIDIAQLKSAQELLQALNATLEKRVSEAVAEKTLLADIVEGTDAFVQVADLNFRWLAINKAAADEFERIFGVRPRIGGSMLEILAERPEHRRAVEAIWARALAGEAFTEIGEYGDPARDRRAYEMRFNTLRDRDGKRIGAYQFVYDVTQRLQDQARLAAAENALLQTQKMETIGQLTGGVAHDFNNLLTPIVGGLDMLRRRFDGDERSQRLVSNALQAAERARTLVQRLLAFSRRQHLQPQATDVGALVRGMADLMSRSLGPRIEIGFDIAENTPAATVDPNQLELAVLNLVVNARDAMAGEGRVKITVRKAEAPAGADIVPGSYVCVSVSDPGVGMDEGTLKRATEPFFTTKGVGRGTGLGLSSVQGLAVQSGGAFRLESRPGQGTSATLWLPVSASKPVAITQPTDFDVTARIDQSFSLLLVDDEELVRSGIAAMLTEAGFRVIEAASASAALQMLGSGVAVDALVTDFAMPGMSGVELAREARTLRPGLPVLMITGYAALGPHEVGGLPRIAKPFGQNELAAAVSDVLGAKGNVVTLSRTRPLVSACWCSTIFRSALPGGCCSRAPRRAFRRARGSGSSAATASARPRCSARSRTSCRSSTARSACRRAPASGGSRRKPRTVRNG